MLVHDFLSADNILSDYMDPEVMNTKKLRKNELENKIKDPVRLTSNGFPEKKIC